MLGKKELPNMKNLIKQFFFGFSFASIAALAPQITSAQTTNFAYTGAEVTYTLGPGTFNITAYGAMGGRSTFSTGHSFGLGAEMEATFYFAAPTTLTILVGGTGGDGPGSPSGPGGGAGGTFVAIGTNALIVAGGGGGAGYSVNGGNAAIYNNNDIGLGGPGYGGAGGGGFTTDGGPGFWGCGQGYSFLHGGGNCGGGFYGASGGGFGGGGGGGNYQGGGGGGYDGGYGGPGVNPLAGFGGQGGFSYISPSAISVGTEVSGVASPDGSRNGYLTIATVSPPTIQTQPASTVVGLGSPVSFSVSATSTETLTYQWQFNATNISGATNSTLTLPSTTLSNIGFYDVIVSTPDSSITSSNASLSFLNMSQVPVLVLYGPVGQSYQIRSSTNFTTGPWAPLTNVTLTPVQPYVYYVNYSSFLTNPPTFYEAIPQ